VDEIPNKIFETHDGGENWNRIARERGGRRRDHPSKPLVGILGDVDGRIVPVAPPAIFRI